MKNNMSEAGKGDNVAKRTNIKAFNEGYDNINWKDTAPVEPPPLPPEMQKRIDDILNRMDAYEQSLQCEIDGEDETE